MVVPAIGRCGIALIIALNFLLLMSCRCVTASEADSFAETPDLNGSACRETDVVIL